MEQNTNSKRKQIAGPSQEEVARRLEEIEKGHFIEGDVMAEIRKEREKLLNEAGRAEWTFDETWSKWVWENNFIYYPDMESKNYAVIMRNIVTGFYYLRIYLQGFCYLTTVNLNGQALSKLAETFVDSYKEYLKETSL